MSVTPLPVSRVLSAGEAHTVSVRGEAHTLMVTAITRGQHGACYLLCASSAQAGVLCASVAVSVRTHNLEVGM